MEKANADFEGNKRTKGRKGGVEELRNDSGVSVTSTKGFTESLSASRVM